MLLIRFGYFQLLLGRGQCRLGGVNLRLRSAVLRRRIVQFLLGNQAGARFIGVDQRSGVGMQAPPDQPRPARRHCAPANLFLSVVDCGLGLIDLGNQFGNLEHRQHLSLMHMITNIDINVRM